MLKRPFNFRKSFKIYDKDVLRYFPGHMELGMKQMQHHLHNVDCVLEVHDARIPFSGRNPNFKSTILGVKPHMLILNKRDLSDNTLNKRIEKQLNKDKITNVIFTNAKSNKCKGIKSIIPQMIELILNSERYNRSNSPDFNMMVIGVPNVGKSTVINLLRSMYTNRGGGVAVGGVAGITRNVNTRMKVVENPPIYVYDTPGILTPNVPNVEVGFKLALCATLQDHIVGEDLIADYLLYWLNKYEKFDYVHLTGLDNPNDNISEVLIKYAVLLKKYQRRKTYDGRLKEFPDHIYAAKQLISAFRRGELGSLLLDRDILAEKELENTGQS